MTDKIDENALPISAGESTFVAFIIFINNLKSNFIKMKQKLNLLMTLLVSMMGYAHHIWLETKPVAELGGKHEVRLYFGDMEEVTPVAQWFSDLKEVEVIVQTPSGKVIKLETEDKGLYSAGYFEATEKGIYTVSFNHLVKDAFKGMKIRYQSVGFVSTDASINKKLTLGDKDYFQLVLQTKIKDGKRNYQMLKSDHLSDKIKVRIELNGGEPKSVRVDKKGNFSFSPVNKDKYMLRFSSSKTVNEKYNGADVNVEYTSLVYVRGTEYVNYSN